MTFASLRLAGTALALALMLPALAGDLPKWADRAVTESAREAAPARAAAWVLLDRTEFLYAGGGEVRVHHWRVVRVLTAEGHRHAFFRLWSNSGPGYEVKSVKGWTQAPQGKVISLDRTQLSFRTDPDAQEVFTDTFVTSLGLPGVVPGSLVAYESEEAMKPLHGPVFLGAVGGPDPVLRWELEADSRWYVSSAVKAEIAPRHLAPWTTDVAFMPGKALHAGHLPGLDGDERGTPGTFASAPGYTLAFRDPKLPAGQRWFSPDFWPSSYENITRGEAPPADLPSFTGEPAARLRQLGLWMGRTFRYRQVYLTPERDWKPNPPSVTLRQRTGDCKDLTAVALAAARKAGFEGHPVRARIGDGVLRGEDPLELFACNHRLAAIQVPEPMGFPSAVQVEGRWYVLYDPTSPTTPMGHLPGAHRGAKVLLCLPTGGHWVEVPAAAVEEPSVDVDVDGTVAAGGDFKGALTLRERGDALRLATTLFQEGPAGLRRALASSLGLNAAATLKILEASDPCAPEAPLKVTAEVDLPGALRAGHVSLPGLPGAPGPIQRLDRIRRSPILEEPTPRWRWRATLKAQGRPAHADLVLETPLRKARWTTIQDTDGLHLALAMEGSGGSWDVARAAEGLRTVDADRWDFAAFLEACRDWRSE